MHFVPQEVSNVDVDTIAALPYTFAERLPRVCLSLVVSEAQIEECEVLLALFKVGERLNFLDEFFPLITQAPGSLHCSDLCFFSQ